MLSDVDNAEVFIYLLFIIDIAHIVYTE